MILVVCLNPTFQRTMLFDSFRTGEVNRCRTHYLDASGKGMNTARILSQMGEDAVLLTHLGGPRKKEIQDLCKHDGISLLWADSQSEIRTCTTILENGKSTELVEEPQPVAPGTEEKICSLFSQAIGKAKALIICGTRAPGYREDLYARFTEEARKAGCFVLLDLKGHDLVSSIAHRPDVVKPNLSEFAQTFFSLRISEEEENDELRLRTKRQMQEIHDRYGCSILLSRSSRDLWLYDGTFSTCPVVPAKIQNPIGCGDTVSAAITSSMLKGATLAEATRRAVRLAAKNGESIHPGTIR